MKKILFASLMAAFLASTSLQAQADPVSLDQWYGFGFGGVGTPLVSGAGTVALTNPPAVDAPDPAWTFTLATAGTLTVLDVFLSIDRFEIFDFGTSLGLTSVPVAGGTCGSDITCALADSDYSRGIFNLAAGSYSITGTQMLGQGGAGAFLVSAGSTPVPEPASILLVALGLGLAGGLRFLRRT